MVLSMSARVKPCSCSKASELSLQAVRFRSLRKMIAHMSCGRR